jgi:hypothetical protein
LRDLWELDVDRFDKYIALILNNELNTIFRHQESARTYLSCNIEI